ncbi:LOW QUALITY PROTEIN: protein trichome birefringence-like 8 [Dioscorea cayenensis subsp. rotundata]|uniref:LOW QUALITY PROTEIN: protein trichome birefringence-like 8 n=1 Tax=Dioscorea cayennensis subsp. rotundata TaxID=55577 RepID=A0AB40C2Z7_DIOCR|nr:LOW QUALITY PROTEIN: protein trichome birefringence-like 8 [Dioscorea cayenensis subsp. rotundata]
MTHTIPSLIFIFFILFILYLTFSSRPPTALRLAYLSNTFSNTTSSTPICDYSSGNWVWDITIPLSSYSESCRFLDPGFQCRNNGRNDTQYLNWRWQPSHCDLLRFNARAMLERNRNKRIVFVGDSIGRNQWESLLCMLASGVENQSSIYELHGLPISKHTGAFFVMRFDDFNLTVEYYRTPYLVLIQPPPPDADVQVRKVIHVDKMQWQSKYWVNADVLIFHVGRWWGSTKITMKGHYFQEGETINMTMDVKEGFRRSLQTWKQWAVSNLNQEKTLAFFNSYSPSHFRRASSNELSKKLNSIQWPDLFNFCRNGTWETGGSCQQNIEPETNLTAFEHEPWHNQVITETIEGMKMVKLLNITYLSNLRKDGHPSSHREPAFRAENIEDCSHWCLPGVPDIWNELLYAYILSNDHRTS